MTWHVTHSVILGSGCPPRLPRSRYQGLLDCSSNNLSHATCPVTHITSTTKSRTGCVPGFLAGRLSQFYRGFAWRVYGSLSTTLRTYEVPSPLITCFQTAKVPCVFRALACLSGKPISVKAPLSLSLARASRDITVPIGISSVSAISSDLFGFPHLIVLPAEDQERFLGQIRCLGFTFCQNQGKPINRCV
jgi:hypothetical protein